jgi:hypothetical protein
MANHRGMPGALIRPTTPTLHEANGDAGAELPDDAAEGNGQGRGDADGIPKKSPKRRPRSSAAGEKCSAHKLSLPDSVFARLELTAIKRGSTASAVAGDILDRNLPRLRIAADD